MLGGIEVQSISGVQRALVWLRRDLRTYDHHAWSVASQKASKVQPIFIIDDSIVGSLDSNDRRISFIQGCLDEVQQELETRGGRLWVQRGDPKVLIPKMAQQLKIDAVFTNHDYEPYAKLRDEQVSQALAKMGVQFFSFKDQVIFEKREILSGGGTPYRVFTPYSRAWLKALDANPKAALVDYSIQWRSIMPAAEVPGLSTSFFDVGFEPQKLDFTPGMKSAEKALAKFVCKAIEQYKEQRDFPAIDGTSALSPHFRFGTVSVREAVRQGQNHLSAGARIWINELIWRDFYHMILDQFPHVVGHAFKPEAEKIRWPGKREHFEAWCEGRTGFPIVDAAMRQLNQTGWMHNRLRMITASFLTKDLLVDWRLGEAYFAKQLLDFDLAANNGGWQWSASTGCDAQPYFRVFNPVSQSEKFDASGDFIRKFVPELARLNSKQIHWPHDEGLFAGSLDYPAPLVDHSIQRERAIQLFK